MLIYYFALKITIGLQEPALKETIMNEPRLRDMSDYNTLAGEKRRVVWAVIIAGLIIGTIYLAAKSCCPATDMIATQDPIVNVPRVQ
jgi:hypothetical protein